MAPTDLSWGELSLGLRLARNAQDRGHHVTFAARPHFARVAAEQGLRAVSLAPPVTLATRIASLVHEHHVDAVIPVDASLFAWVLSAEKADPAFLTRLGVSVVALDVWDAFRPGFTWDLGSDREKPDLGWADSAQRLVPAPFVRPAEIRQSFNALPELRVRGVRRTERRAFGIGTRERLLVLTTAPWQHPGRQIRSDAVRSATLVPWLVAAYLGRLPETVRVLHIGPEGLTPMARTLGERYRHVDALAPTSFERVIAAADALLTLNASATGIGTAIALAVPAVAVVNGRTAMTADDAFATMPQARSVFLERWVRRAVPLHPFSVWPIGLHEVMKQALRNNPYSRTFVRIDLLDERAFVESLHAVLFDRSVRHRIRDAQLRYQERLSLLPRAVERLEAVVGR